MISQDRAVPDTGTILNSIRRLVRALHLYSRESERRTGLSAAQLFVMQQLFEGAPLSLKVLAKQTMTDLSSTSVVVERLVKKGLIIRKRSEQDGRVLELGLSAKGKILFRQQPDPLQARLIRSIETMKTFQRRALARSFEKLLIGAGIDGERPALFFELEGE